MKNIGIGQVYSYRKQDNVNKGNGYFDTTKVFWSEDSNGKVYIDDKLCSIVKTPGESNLVKIGDRFYKFVQIGTRIWLAENLDYYVDGSLYYNNDPTQSYGLLYSPTSIELLDTAIEGWHVPYAGELDELSFIASGISTRLKSKTSWATNPGIDSFGFDGKAGGSYNDSIFANKSYYGLFYSQTKNTSNQNYRMNLANDYDEITLEYVNNNNYLSIRLIKDTEPVEIGGRKYKTQKIGNQIWMTENLDYIFEGLTVGGATLQDDIHAWYYKNDPAQSNGLMYNGYAAKYLAEHTELLPEGWRVPTYSDISTLILNAGDNTVNGTHLKTAGTMNGNDYYGFNGSSQGFVRSTGAFDQRNTILRCWTEDINDSGYQSMLSLEANNDQANLFSINIRGVAYAIRLVKDF